MALNVVEMRNFISTYFAWMTHFLRNFRKMQKIWNKKFRGIIKLT